jgi:O-antigen/teichoic acid export membrane protein
MTIYDIGTWAAVGVLTVGAGVVFAFFLKDARRILREMGSPDDDRDA